MEQVLSTLARDVVRFGFGKFGSVPRRRSPSIDTFSKYFLLCVVMALPSSPLPSPVCFVTWHQTDELMDFVNSNEPPSKIEHATLLHLSHLSLLFRKRSLLFLCSWILGAFQMTYLRIFRR